MSLCARCEGPITRCQFCDHYHCDDDHCVMMPVPCARWVQGGWGEPKRKAE